MADWQLVQAKDEDGGFVRQTSTFRDWVTPDGSAGPTGEGGKAEVGRYHLYVALICPWASRALIGRKLKCLEDVISLSVVEPELSGQGWRFADYPALSRYQTRILAMPSVRDTVSMDHINRSYYSIKALNPTGIVPVEPALPTPLAA